jgi:thiol-disulfide isomerase/thioredoxin
MKKIVTFTASWCGPCKMLKPVLQKLFDDNVIVWENYDIDENKELAQTMQIKSVPTLIFHDEAGAVYHTQSGFMPHEKILFIYNKHLKEEGVANEHN